MTCCRTRTSWSMRVARAQPPARACSTACAQWQIDSNLNLHDISVQDIGNRLHVEQHVELDERLSLKDAHDRVTRLEAR